MAQGVGGKSSTTIGERSPIGSFAEYVRNNRVFILGAGFSAAAGIPLTASLLGKTMQNFSLECPGIFARVDGYAGDIVGGQEIDYSRIDLSDFCTFLEYVELRQYGGGDRWTNAGSREKLALRFYLAKTVAEHTPAPNALPELYLQFAAQLHERDVVISFNWDCLLEIAILSVGKTYTYNFEEDTAIKLCKLHGSINWRLGEPQNLHGPSNMLGWKSLNFTRGMMTTEIYHTPSLLEYAAWDQAYLFGEVEPFLVLPGYGKGFDVRFNAPLWYKPESMFAATHDIFIIGLSLARDDFFIRSLFISTLPYVPEYSGVAGRHIYIINPDPAAEKNYQFVLSKGYATLLRKPFAIEHVKLMQANRSR